MINDVNDNVPRFIPDPASSPALYTGRIAEGQTSLNSVILDLNATDSDEGNNAAVVYSIHRGDVPDHFAIDSANVSLAKFYTIIHKFS